MGARQAVERETGEEAVFGVGNERGDLPVGARQQYRPLRLLNIYVLVVLAPEVSYRFVVKRFPKPVRVIAEVGLHHHGERVAFCFCGKPSSIVVVERLINGRRAGVGRNLECLILRWGRRGIKAFGGGFVSYHGLFVVSLLLLIGSPNLVLNRLYDPDGISELTLGRCRRSCYEPIEIGIYLFSSVDTYHVGYR